MIPERAVRQQSALVLVLHSLNDKRLRNDEYFSFDFAPVYPSIPDDWQKLDSDTQSLAKNQIYSHVVAT